MKTTLEPHATADVSPIASATRSTAAAVLQELRPKQWIKNLLLFAGVIFTHNLADPNRLFRAFLGFLVFCGLSGVVYIYNDIRDAASDRQHPLKCKRPIACGELSVSVAAGVGVVLALVCLVGAFFLNARFGAAALVYFSVMLLYSAVLKHMVILDLMIVSLGFVIRAVAGVLVIEYPGEDFRITPWFITCILFLALFIILCKRRHEIVLLSDTARHHRPVLEHYSPAFLDQMVSIATAATVLSYTLYITSGITNDPKRQDYMILTLPFVLYGVFRYLYLVYKKDEGGSPEAMLLKDPGLLINVVLWLVTIAIINY